MDTSFWLLISLACGLLVLGFVFRGKPSTAPAQSPGRARSEPQGSQPGNKTSKPEKRTEGARSGNGAKRSKPRPMPQPLPGADDDDLEITLITAFPLAELQAQVAKEASISDLARPQPKVDVEKLQQTAEGETTRVELMYEDEAELEETTSPVARILVSAAGDSDQGRKRPRNEDSLLVFPERSLFVVADGMGGHAGGQVASAVAVDTLRDAFEKGNFDARTECEAKVPRRGRELACAIQMANQAIYNMAAEKPELNQMGTTVVAARFSPNKQRVYIGHVGDSRCYRLRGNVLRQLTTDHTMKTLGVKGPRAHELFQAVGVKPAISIDLIVDKPRDNDIYLLCSDGLCKMIPDEEVRDMLLEESDLEAAVYGLIERANDRGGKDNITLILVKVLSRVADELRGMR
ncbi:MAG TPA: PP2C family serine/threonine-protein phosphatase [Polyangiaceae bacterium]|nr:PP2C family serine/threonine-protein phosphatase [Polyangiaceae bacterium]